MIPIVTVAFSFSIFLSALKLGFVVLRSTTTDPIAFVRPDLSYTEVYESMCSGDGR